MTAVESVTTRHGITDLLAGLRSQVSNWLTVAVLMQLVLPSRWLPHGGLQRTRLGARAITVKLRNGYRVLCPIGQLYPLFETFVFPTYDLPELEKARTIVDVGAHIGWATLWFGLQAPHAEIVAVEPDPRWWTFFDRNMRANHLAERIRLVKAAVAGTTGHAALGIDHSTWLAHLERSTQANGSSTAAISLKDLLGQVRASGPIDVLKLDCEGAEYDILPAAGNDVLRRIRVLVAEYHPVPGHGPEELRAQLQAAGFAVEVKGSRELGMLRAQR